MKTFITGAAGALCLCLLAPAAGAAPLGAAGGTASAAAPPEVIVQVHGLHSACRRDRFGWHRSYLWGRERCIPAHLRHRHMHRHHFKKKRH